MRSLLLACLTLLAACRPPATDPYVERMALEEVRDGPRVLATSPETEDAVWAESGGPHRIVFGHPGQAPLLAIECARQGALLVITRFASTDPGAKGMMALVGNGHVERLKIDALDMGGKRGWLWQGRYNPLDPRLDALTGARRLELTIPGAGTLVLSGSSRPAELIDACRRRGAPANVASPSPPA